ncbi:MAG: DNA polymerase IV [Deltaproteobacteria bacterium]|nr:MAG: DNA polymerase IV [Deltaproteobacteria bacterium]
MTRTILHIDMDAFFAAIEVLDSPSLKGKPVIVGGSTKRGVVSTASYEARRFGIHSAMPIFQAKERCPQGIFLPVKKDRYKEVSKKVMDILRDFTPLVEQVSIDEAYLDITGSEALFGNAEEIARHIKARIGKETGLTCSIGIGPNKFLAKVASDIYKPDGLTIILADDVDKFLSRLPVEKIPGVGRRTIKGLRHYGIKTIGDLKRFSKEQLLKDLGRFGGRLYELAKGMDNSPVVPYRGVKSISSEETLSSDTGDLSILKERVISHADKVAWRLRKEGLKGRTITLKIKLDDFTEMSKGLTVRYTTDSTKIISDSAIKQLKDYPLKRKVRLIGVTVSNLEGSKEGSQTSLFMAGGKKEKERKTDEAMDEIRERFGGKVIKRGRG